MQKILANEHQSKDMENGIFTLAENGELDPEFYPELGTLSAGFMYRFMPQATRESKPEFVFFRPHTTLSNDEMMRVELAAAEWNMAWEAGYLRKDFFRHKLHRSMAWLETHLSQNLYLFPIRGNNRYDTYAPLFHLLPLEILKRFGLPPVKHGIWPYLVPVHCIDEYFPDDFDDRLSNAIAHYLWRYLDTASPISAFSESDSIRLLSHNLNF